jgi:peptide/nickel transport system substrate-binding protein
LAIGVAAVLTLAACGGGGQSAGESAGQSDESAAPTGDIPTGGTIYILTLGDGIDQIDPQRAYTGEDLAFFGSTIYRSLTAFQFSADLIEGTTLVPDLATDTGTQSDAGKTWTFTLRDGPKWQDGTEINCEDVKYGISRTFAVGTINQGPTYQIQYLDIPTVEGFAKQSEAAGDPNPGQPKDASGSAYGGPYDDDLLIYSDESLTTFIPNDKAAYDEAVVCDGKTITFHLAKPVGDFNYATTLGMFPVPNPDDHPGVDTGATYAVAAPPMSSGPYKIDSYTTGNGGKLIMSRNENWDQANDPYRHAYPDAWEYHFGINPDVIDQRLIQNSGIDQQAIGGAIRPHNLPVIFSDPETTLPQFAGRAFSSFDPYTRYLWINVVKVPDVKVRQAIAVALDRDAMRKNLGGDFYGDYADGAVKPTIGADYAPTGLWETGLGQPIPDTGDPEFAKTLLSDAGVSGLKITFDYPQTATRDKEAALIVTALARAGITVTPNPIEASVYYSVVFYTAKGHEFGYGGWGADWPNASTVVAPLFTVKGGWDLSFVDDAAFNAEVDAALAEVDRAKQQVLWQALNKKAAEQMYLIPTFFGLTQRIAGSKIGNVADPDNVYLWSAWGSWAYGDMYVKP